MAKNTEVATVETKLPALPQDMLDMLAADAKAAAALERPAMGSINFRAGVMSYNGEQIKGNKLSVIIVGAAFLNVYYGSKFDPDHPSNPDCFAISPDGKEMAPHENVARPISPKCAMCAYNQWGSDVRDGKPTRGKRCKEVRKLVALPASALADGAEAIAVAELAQMRLPVTSIKAWGGFVNTVAATLALPYYAVVADITTVPDMKTQFKVIITPSAPIQDAEVLGAIMRRREEAMRICLLPFDTDSSEDPDPSAAPAELSKEKF